MATQQAFNNAINYSYGAGKYNSGIPQAQELWANQYTSDPNPTGIGRYLDYTNTLGLNNINKTYGSGANINAAQHDFFNKYSQQVANGTNNLSQLDQYNQYAKAFGLTSAKPSDSVMRQLSIAALNGSTGAQNYLTKMGLSAKTGSDLWNGVDPNQLQVNSPAYTQYTKDNPYSDISKTNDTNYWNHFNDVIKNGGAMTPDEQNSYNQITQRWNLTNMNDPYNLAMAKNDDSKKQALDAQDTALNQSLSALDAKSAQTMNSTQQAMENRGLGDSGLAADAYARATMAQNADYQKAFADAATSKANINNTYNQQNADLMQKQQAAAADAMKAQQDYALNLQKQQSTQDQFMTQQTGYVWVNGQMVTKADGTPFTTLDYQKLLEDARHNQATEANSAQQTAISAQNDFWNYQVNQQNANTNATKAANDYNMAQAKFQLDLKNYDLNSEKIQADIADMQTKASNAAMTYADKTTQTKIDALNKQLSYYMSYAKSFKNPSDVPQATKDTINSITSQLNNYISQLGGGSGSSGEQTTVDSGGWPR